MGLQTHSKKRGVDQVDDNNHKRVAAATNPKKVKSEDNSKKKDGDYKPVTTVESDKWERLIKELKEDTYFKEFFRNDWKSSPRDIDERKFHLCKMENNEYVGLQEKPKEMLDLFEKGRQGRAPIGMLSACSGSGKSALMQYCEEKINKNANNVLCLAVTFKNSTHDFTTTLTALNGLTMRIVERFLMKRTPGYSFQKFRKFWIENNHDNIDIDTARRNIQDILKDKGFSRNLLILVDEPGLAGGKGGDEDEGKRPTYGTDSNIARHLACNAKECGIEKHVRYVFSSQKPLYSEGQLVKTTFSGGPVTWIDVPYVSQVTNRDGMQKIMDHRLKSVKALMPDKHYKLASDLIITMASGHWSTFDSILKHLDPPALRRTTGPAPPGEEPNRSPSSRLNQHEDKTLEATECFKTDAHVNLETHDQLPSDDTINQESNKEQTNREESKLIAEIEEWMSILYYENIRDVVVQIENASSKLDITNSSRIYRSLVIMAILGIQVHPLNTKLMSALDQYEASQLPKNIETLNDMAFHRIVQNRIGAASGTHNYRVEVPNLSLLDVRKWCLRDDTQPDEFKNAIKDALDSAGHDPTKTPIQEPLQLGMAFERTATALLHAKFLAWQECPKRSEQWQEFPGMSEQKPEAPARKSPTEQIFKAINSGDEQRIEAGYNEWEKVKGILRKYQLIDSEDYERVEAAFKKWKEDKNKTSEAVKNQDESQGDDITAGNQPTTLRDPDPKPKPKPASATTSGVAPVQVEKSFSLGSFLGGTFLFGENVMINAPKSGQRKPKLLHIESKGGFRSNQRKDQPKQLKDEEDEKFTERESKWFEKALEPLKFSECVKDNKLRNGDIICPGAKNQPHSENIILAEKKLHNAEVPLLIFEQMKCSERDSSTTPLSKEIIAGLEKLRKEQGFLYDVTSKVQNPGNQISALKIKEENVVYFWNVSRRTAAPSHLKAAVTKAAKALEFKGSIMIANGNDEIFGQTFKNLALLHRSCGMGSEF